MAEKSDPHFAPADLLVTTPTPSIQILAQENLLQKQKERVERLPQPDRLIKICIDARFLKTVEVGQFFMTKPWVRISRGLNKLVTDLIDKEYDDNEQETSETKSEVFSLKTNVLAFAS